MILPTAKIQLARVQNTLGIALSPAALAVQGADLKDARMLHYDEYDIAQITYLDALYGPMALCITRSEHRDNTALQREIRRGMNVVYWRNAGYNFMLIATVRHRLWPRMLRLYRRIWPE